MSSESKIQSQEASTKLLWLFDELPAAEALAGSWDATRGLLGGKGANLARMTSFGLPVPYGFTIGTPSCLEYSSKLAKTGNRALVPELEKQIKQAVAAMEKKTGCKLGDHDKPLLLSVRSGAKFSMPGMMDTVLNVGMTSAMLGPLSKKSDKRFTCDSYRRLIQGFGAIVRGVEDSVFESTLASFKKQKGYSSDLDCTGDDWLELAEQFKKLILKHAPDSAPFPDDDPLMQILETVAAVFGSWNSPRATAYRNKTGIPHSLGTACNVQAMVFGNRGDQSCSGVAFSRSPVDGTKRLYGEFLVNAQGEDVVSGVRTPTDVNELATVFPEALLKQLKEICALLERKLGDMQDIEFTIQEGTLYMLQTRDGKRTPKARCVIACDMVREGLISKEQAVERLSADDVNVMMLPQLEPGSLAKASPLCKGISASPGGAVGRVVFDAASAEEEKSKGESVILVRKFTKPDDVPGFFASKGILTAEGGATSHAAVVARQFGLPCVCGAADIEIDEAQQLFRVKDVVVRKGDYVSLDANSGRVFVGAIKTAYPSFDDEKELRTILGWADDIAASHGGLRVFANADNGLQAERAVRYGARGIGLCRTEHMFFGVDRLPLVRTVLSSSTDEERQAALDKLLPVQRGDFEDLFKAMADKEDIIIRLLDAPLHEFVDEKESNPMLGLRGVRLGVVVPQVVDMQLRAIVEAALAVGRTKANGKTVKVMVPLTAHASEMAFMEHECRAVVDNFGNGKVQVILGTMIETPRAALCAGAIAKQGADFFSFGTNDLTQMTLGYSRDDAEREWMAVYMQEKILLTNPFQTLDTAGVGRLIRIASKEGKEANAKLSVGVCGEHGGDLQSILFLGATSELKGLVDYVSCSPFRIPAARLACAQASLKLAAAGSK